MINYEKLLKEVIDLLGDEFDGAVGLRGDNSEYAEGTELWNSRFWEDGIETDEVLDGTSAIIISADWKYDTIQTIEENINRYANLAEDYGENIYLVVGDVAEGGNDIGEIVIPSCRVLKKINKEE